MALIKAIKEQYLLRDRYLSGMTFSFMFVLVALLGACSKQVEKSDDIRSVRAIVVGMENTAISNELSGDIRARIESRLAFRVGGKIIARKVDVGSMVKRGDVLMRLDPQDLQLVQTQSNAALTAAKTAHELASAEMKRYQDLYNKEFISKAVLEAKESNFKATKASYDQAVAMYSSQKNQTGYTTLVADSDGVVTGIDAEVGQVIAPGNPVIRIAQLGEKEVVVSIPENQVGKLKYIKDIKVHVWANPKDVFSGSIREISPVADPVTRTYNVKIAIKDAPSEVKLGMTAYVTFISAQSSSMIKVPLSSVFYEQGENAVWVVENNIVKPVRVEIDHSAGNDILLAKGISSGQTIVTAGVHLLKAGQKVKLLPIEKAGSSNDYAGDQNDIPFGHTSEMALQRKQANNFAGITK
jgi:multidrug efflux system membrane fusion protein